MVGGMGARHTEASSPILFSRENSSSNHQLHIMIHRLVELTQASFSTAILNPSHPPIPREVYSRNSFSLRDCYTRVRYPHRNPHMLRNFLNELHLSFKYRNAGAVPALRVRKDTMGPARCVEYV